MAFSSGFSDINISDLLKIVSEEQLLAYYFNVSSVPCRIQAPYRQDNNPSVGIYISNKTNKIQFTDFATKEAGGLLDLLMKVWNCDFKKCVNKIVSDLPNINKTIKPRTTVSNSHILYHKSSIDIQVKFREWKQYDIEFWESFGISKPWLEFGEIYPISRIFYISEKVTDVPADKYAYAYIERKDGKVTLKIYQPFSNIHKWINKHDSSVWDLWTKLPQSGEKLIITSSRKDALCVWENTGIPCVSLQGEGYIPKEHIVQSLKERFLDIYILYDNDFKSTRNVGREFGKSIADKYNLIQIEIPTKYNSKDPSDLCKNYNRNTVTRVIYNLIENSTKQLNSYYQGDLPF